jgi:hypothetical protein
MVVVETSYLAGRRRGRSPSERRRKSEDDPSLSAHTCRLTSHHAALPDHPKQTFFDAAAISPRI